MTDAPRQLEGRRHVGDKRTGLVYDLEASDPTAGAPAEGVLDSIVAAECYATFGPDTLAEARNRGYTLANGGALQRLRRKLRWKTTN